MTAPAATPIYTGIMSELNESGDTKVIWDRNNPDEVAAARATFDALAKTKRYLAYKVKEGGDQGEQIRAFDPNAERIILVPPMVGG